MASSRAPQTFGDLEPSRWPGERLGLPERGARSVARVGRRLLALLIDYTAATLIAMAFLQYDPWALPAEAGWRQFAPLMIFALLQVVFIPTIGGSIGHRLLGMRVVPISGGWVGFWRPIVRTLLIALVIPVLVWDSDQRGFHDKIAGTVLVRT
ncbi:RDD family protein [Leucobacter sp. GX24907]